MTSENETIQSKQLLEQIQDIKEKLQREREDAIQKIKEEYKQKEKEQTIELKKQRARTLSLNFYNKNHKKLNKPPTLKDQYATEIFGKSYKECNVLEQKVVNNKYRREYRKRIREGNKNKNV